MNQKSFGRARKGAALALAALLALSAAGCSQSQPPAEAGEGKGVIPVQVQAPSVGDISLETEFIGTIKPGQSVNVIPKASGTVLAVYHQVGDVVEEGDLLFEIDPEAILLSVNQARAAYNGVVAQMAQTSGSSYKSQLNSLDANYDGAYDALETARDRYDNTERELNAGIAPLQEAANNAKADLDAATAALEADPENTSLINAKDEAQLAYNAAQNALTAARATAGATLDTLDSAVDSARRNFANIKRSYDTMQNEGKEELDAVVQTSIQQAQTALDLALYQLDNTKVYAPISGVVEQKNVEEQNMVSSSGPAFVISNKEMITVEFNVSATAVEGIVVGDALHIENGGKSYTGTVTEVDAAVNPQTGLFKVSASVANAGADLYTGLTVKVTAVTQQTKGARLIPQDAVYYDNGAAYVYLMADGKAVKTPVTLGITNAEQVEVTEGLAADAQVITTWHPNLMDGAAVQATAQEG